MATEIWVNLDSGNGLLPDDTKPLPEPMLTDHQWNSSDIHIRAISQEMPQPLITKIRLKMAYRYLNFNSNFSGANELIHVRQVVICPVQTWAYHWDYVFWHNFSGMKEACWTTGCWRCCLSLEVVSSIPAESTIIYRFLCGFICISLCQSINIYIYIYHFNQYCGSWWHITWTSTRLCTNS